MLRHFLSLTLFFTLTFQLAAQQCTIPDASIWDNTWQSCLATPNPNTARGTSHWIRYDLGQNYTLYRMRFWNHNKADELTKGAKDIAVDYSTNGTSWTALGNYRLPKAKGDAIYGGVIGPDFSGISARYVIITILSNWGDSSCNGLAEVKFMLAPQNAAELDCDSEILTVNSNPIPTDIYHAQASLSSIGNVDLSNHVIFRAGETILMDAGFEVKSGNTLCAEIEDCLLQINP